MAAKRARWGHIETLEPGKRYRIKWPDKHKPDGKRRQPSETIHGTWDDASLALAKKHIELEGVFPDVTWGEFWAGKVEPTFHTLAQRTQRDYRRIWDAYLKPRISDDLVASTTYDDVCRVIDDIPAPSAQRYAHRLWRKMCNMAMRDRARLLTFNPVDRSVPMRKVVHRVKHEIAACDLLTYIERLDGTVWKYMVILEAVGGFRHEEAVPLLPENIWRSGDYAEVEIIAALTSIGGIGAAYKETKTEGSVRTALFAEPFASMLLEWPERIGGPLFSGPHPQGDEPNETWFVYPDNVTRRWRQWCSAHNVEYVRPGDMRTIYSDRCGEAGIPDSLVALSMGHSDGTTRGTNYQRRTRKGMELVADSLAEYLVEESQRRGTSRNIAQ